MKFTQLGRDYESQLENWRLWARVRDDRPRGYRPLIPYSGKGEADREPRRVIFAWDAYDFNELVQSLPDHPAQRQRSTFLVEYVSRFKRGPFMLFVPRRDDSYRHRLIGMSRHVYERTLKSAELAIKRSGGLDG